MKILEEFWYGNIQTSEKTIPLGGRHVKLLNLLVQHENNLTALLSDEAKELFDKFKDTQDELSSVSECDAFVREVYAGGNGRDGSTVYRRVKQPPPAARSGWPPSSAGRGATRSPARTEKPAAARRAGPFGRSVPGYPGSLSPARPTAHPAGHDGAGRSQNKCPCS